MRETFLRSVLLQFGQRKSSLETKQSCELWVLFMVGPLRDDAGNNHQVRGRRFDGSTSPCAKDSAGVGRTVPGGIASRVRPWLVWSWALLDDHRNGACGLGRVENFRAVGFAIHPQPFGQANDDSFPCDVAAEVFVEFGAMVATLECGAILKPGLDGLLGLLDLLLELVEPTAQRQKHGQF